MNNVHSTPYVDRIVRDMMEANIPAHKQLARMIEVARGLEASRNRMMCALDTAANALDSAGLDWSAGVARDASRVLL
jgi:hypothetical protein